MFKDDKIKKSRHSAIVWMPDFVLRQQKSVDECRCPGCHSSPPLLQFRWKNHVRHSASIGCERAAKAILCHPTAFGINVSEAVAENLPELNPDLLAVNQACLRLMAEYQAEPEAFLFALSRFISGFEKSNGQTAYTIEQALSALQPQQLRQEFIQRRPFDIDKLAALRALSEASLDREHSRIAQKLNKLKGVPDRLLRQNLHVLEKQWHSGTPQQALHNYLYYELYHNFFPGCARQQWQQNLALLCQKIFRLKILLIFSLRFDYSCDDISVLVAACHRTGVFRQ
ncbi:hypothetical protein [Erwinia phyllosphaerae]|uniref:hypothetical protein n=1 Tax=Erwinia phyllosphaerae TaxID=2853256 RepID=UPI001FEE9337|nr:hypothetical protein [Erwinia phyllosphaerae]MBV4367207.1 hypothetical protein [Erwinia phyllosphaerae]